MIFGNCLAPCTRCRGWEVIPAQNWENCPQQRSQMISYNTKYYKQITPLLTRPDRTKFYICNTVLVTAVIIAHTILTSILSILIQNVILPHYHTHILLKSWSIKCTGSWSRGPCARAGTIISGIFYFLFYIEHTHDTHRAQQRVTSDNKAVEKWS